MMAADSLRATAARIAELEGEVFELREQLGVDLKYAKLARLIRRGMPPLQAKCMLLLYERGDRPVNGSVFDMAIPPIDHANEREWKILNTVICYVRRRLPAGAIETVWSQGYVMTPPGRALVAEWLGDAA